MKLFVTKKTVDQIKMDAMRSVKPEEKSINHTDMDALRNTTTASFSFSDPNVRVFAVQRMAMGNSIDERTVVGYYLVADFANGKVGEKPTDASVIRTYNVYCSRDQNNKLVEEFVASCKAYAEEALKPTIAKDQKKLLKG
jgi:hypothetical protein